jgi:hypothetical protein
MSKTPVAFYYSKTSITVLTVSPVTVAHASSEPRGSAPNFRGHGDLTSGSLLVAFKLALQAPSSSVAAATGTMEAGLSVCFRCSRAGPAGAGTLPLAPWRAAGRLVPVVAGDL